MWYYHQLPESETSKQIYKILQQALANSDEIIKSKIMDITKNNPEIQSLQNIQEVNTKILLKITELQTALNNFIA